MNANEHILEEERSASTGFAAMVRMLTLPEAFPFELPTNTSIAVIQTHASAVLLTSKLVHKLKKPKNFGFFDFSTPSLRRHFCGEEVRVNRRYAPQVYLGVAPERLAQRWKMRIGASTGALEEASRASDARPDLYEAQSSELEAYNRGDEPGTDWMTVKTTLPLAVSCEQVYGRVRIPRFACWL